MTKEHSPRRLIVSFSGGETSGLMAKIIKEEIAKDYDEVVYAFANTSEENEETLIFADAVDKWLGLNLVWLEAEIRPGHGNGTRHQVVTFETARRNGEVFEGMIEKYGIPNQAFPHCTRELKTNPINSYLRSIGWEAGTYDTAIGFRTDEMDRVPANHKERRLVFPLIGPFPHTKAMVNEKWFRFPFRLKLKSYNGNCRACWKKTLRKLLTIAVENPEHFEFSDRMEREKADCGAGEGARVFFRENRSARDVLEMARTRKFTPYHDEARQYQINMFSIDGFDPELDVGGDCNDACEAML